MRTLLQEHELIDIMSIETLCMTLLTGINFAIQTIASSV
jgi:hypothetical protein